MVEYPSQGCGPIKLAPNRSLSKVAALRIWLGMAAFSLAITVTLAALGYWPPLPWAGLELGALGAAFWWVQRRADRSEVLTLRPDRLAVECRDQGRAVFEIAFHPAWVSVVWCEHRHSPALYLRCHGQQTEIGDFLAAREKQELARRLPAWIAKGREGAGD